MFALRIRPNPSPDERQADPALGWRLAMCPHCGEELSVPAQEERLDVERLAAAAQNHETSGIHGPLHCSLACGATIAAEYRTLR